MVYLIKKCENANDKEYNIVVENAVVGILQIIEDNRDFIFIRQIHIFDEFQKKGFATQVINLLVETSAKPIRFCIATNSKKAVAFWSNYLSNTYYNKKHLRSAIWELQK